MATSRDIFLTVTFLTSLKFAFGQDCELLIAGENYSCPGKETVYKDVFPHKDTQTMCCKPGTEECK